MVRPSGDQRGDVSLPPFSWRSRRSPVAHVDDPDVAPPIVVGGRIGPGLEGDVLRVGRPVGVADREVALGQPPPRLGRLQVVQPEVGHSVQGVDDLGVALLLAALLLLLGERIARREQEGRAVRGELERLHRFFVLGDLPRLAAVGVQEVHLRLRVLSVAPRGEERDDLAIGRPFGSGGALRSARELAVARTVDAHAPHVGDRLEVGVVHVARSHRVGDPHAVGRQGGAAHLVDAQSVSRRQDPRRRRVLGAAESRPGGEDEDRPGNDSPRSQILHVTSTLRSGGRGPGRASPKRLATRLSTGAPEPRASSARCAVCSLAPHRGSAARAGFPAQSPAISS